MELGEGERGREREEALMSEDIHGSCHICLATLQGHAHTTMHTNVHTHKHTQTPHAHPLLYSVVHAHTLTLTGKGDVQSDSTHAHSSISAAFPSVMVNNYTNTHTFR